MIDEGNTRVLAVHAVTGNTIMGEGFLTLIPCFFVIRQRILLAFVANEEVMFGKCYGLCF